MVAEIRLFNGFQNSGRYIAHIEHTHMHARTHAHTHPFNGPFLGLLSEPVPETQNQSGFILLEQETVSGSGISWAICKSTPCSRQITMPTLHHSVFLQTGCPSCHPTNSAKALKANFSVLLRWLDLREILMGSSTKGMQKNCCGRLKRAIFDQSGYISETVLGWDIGNYCMSSHKNSSTFITCKCYLEVICLPS